MSHDSGSAAQPDRVAKDLYAQKVYGEFVTRPISNQDGVSQNVLGYMVK